MPDSAHGQTARRGPGPSAAVDHRPRRRPSAAVERRRLDLDRLQRRDLQLSRAAPAAGRRRPPVPHATATPKRSSISTRTRAWIFSAPQRHVRAGHLGRQHAAGSCWPATGSAKSRSSIATSPDGCCSPASSRACCKCPACRARSIPRAHRRVSDAINTCPHPRTIFRGFRKLPPGHYGVYRRRQARRRAAIGSPISTARSIGRWPTMRRGAARAARPRPCSCDCEATCRWERSSPAASIRRSSSG